MDSELGGVSETHFRPEFRMFPSDFEVPEGQPARFNYIVTGKPTPNIDWFHYCTGVIHLAGLSMGEKGKVESFIGPRNV